MSKLLSALIAVAFGFVTASSFAADTATPAEPAAVPAKADKPMKKHVKRKYHPKNKMADCNKEAKEKAMKGAARRKFMSGCLKKGEAKPTHAKAATPAQPADTKK